MALSNASDVNVWLDGTNVFVTDADDNGEQDQVDAMIRAHLGNVIPASVTDTWNMTTPASVPPIIRSIAGRLVAAIRYGKLTSENEQGVSPYAQRLWNLAVAELNGIVEGRITIPEVDEALVDLGSHIGAINFYPNDSLLTGPKFGMDSEF